MGLGNILLLAQVTLFVLSFILSLFILTPLATNQREFAGHCLLYGTGHWKDNVTGGTPELVDVDWGPDSACGFNVFMSVFIMLVSLFYTVKFSIHLFKNSDR